jgi:hypothetical protein
MKMPYFTEKGIAEICRICSQFERPLLIEDTLFKLTIPALPNPLIKDTSPEYMIPHQNLEQALQALAPDCVVTEWVCAHSKKGQGAGIQGRMRGTNQGTGDASHIIGINWLTPDGDSVRTDHRRQVITDGRDIGDALICELVKDDADGHWICHGNARETMAKESKRQMLEGMSDKRRNLWTWMQWKAIENIEGGTFDTGQCAKAGSMAFSSAWDVLKQWLAQGFIEKAGEVPPGPQGGRANVIYRVASEWIEPDQLDQPEITPIGLRDESAQVTELKEVNLVSSTNSALSSLGSNSPIPVNSVEWEGGAPDFLPAKVQIKVNGQPWTNGWVLTGNVATLNPHNLTVQMFGNSNLTMPGLRWGREVRLCQHVPPTQPEPEPGEPGYDPNAPF